MKFLVDNQLPVTLARFLKSKGVECEHVLDLGLAQESDYRIWSYAAEHNAVIVSKDEDFFHLTGIRREPVQFVWIRVGNCRTRALLAAIETAWPRVLACLRTGERVVEIR